VEKSLLAWSSPLIILAAAVWGTTYLVFNETVSGLLSFAYLVVTLVSLLVFARTRRYRVFLFSQLLIGMTFPFIHTILLGGMWNSSMVILWTLAGPIGALLFYPLRYARWWWLAFVVLISTSVLLHPLIEHDNNLPLALRRIFLVLNLVSVSSISLLALYYFIGQKNEAYRLLHIEQQKSENLLLNVLPREIAAILKNEDRTIADSLDGVSILFADMVGFTPLTAHMAPKAVVGLLNDIFSHFDELLEKHGVEKIRTMGDNYMVAAGVPRPRADHAHCLATMALEMQDYLQQRRENTGMPIDFRIGINSGSVVGGVIGHKKFVYDVWGDAVNIASRMQSQGVAGKIQVTRATYELICDDFILERRGTINLRGRGTMETWFLVGRKEEQAREYSGMA
jgi:guanylate cyclase